MVRVFNRALTTEEIKALQNETPDLISHYTMDNISGNSSWGAIEEVVHIPENGRVIVGDFSMSGSEFKTCMKLLQKMAMKEMPEEYI